MSSRKGFTLVELMVSIAILMLLSTTTVFSLRVTRENDELSTAARLLSSDLRNVQARSLAARNVKTCTISGGTKRVCEDENTSAQACVDTCAAVPPPRFGVTLTTGSGKYVMFADVSTEDWRLSNAEEILLGRNLNPLDDKVLIQTITTEFGSLSTANVGVSRQSGTMRIEACGDAGLPVCAPTEPRTLTVTLRHVASGKETTVSLNSVTGRVSIP
jgi:prepilin-type N-terminal cleavage/methylation domain-containing protein